MTFTYLFIEEVILFISLQYIYKLKIVLVPSRFSHVRLFVTLWTLAFQASLSMEFSRQEY